MKRLLVLLIAFTLIGCQSVDNTSQTVNQNTVSVDLSDPVEETEIEVVEEVPTLEGYVFLGEMSDNREVFYKPSDAYFKMELCSEIIIRKDEAFLTLESGILSKPSISPDKERLAFVENVGLDLSGTLFIYKDELVRVESEEIDSLIDKDRAIKSAIWLNDSQVLSLVGFYQSNISQGGDVYRVNVDNGDMKIIVDSKEGFEIADVDYNEGILSFSTVVWHNGNYSDYEYFDTSYIYSEISTFPIVVDKVPDN
ncbi:DUF4652 domain-containing protein [Acidaminobacter sp. JC074]|uniref:DUF4652 domain-containing protein n=1 Tax=Acidaminobacter sp. JC074 TaxID=2530199 RepID=UPI001F111636|nr:DUF4652 domain-containing protein [Acidaminobacter sp. JC074]MCH4886569.1 DUF4652 domain-containing protein [Acidaminobacter sp. JC074]